VSACEWLATLDLQGLVVGFLAGIGIISIVRLLMRFILGRWTTSVGPM